MSIRNITVSTDRVAVPHGVVRKGRTYQPSPFDVLFQHGVTPEGEAYSVPVPPGEEPKNYRQQVTVELQRAANHFNGKRPGRVPLGSRTAFSEDWSTIYVWVVKRRAEPGMVNGDEEATTEHEELQPQQPLITVTDEDTGLVQDRPIGGTR